MIKIDNEFNIYFGVPHSHTSYSDGKCTPTEAFQHALYNKIDFLAITEHNTRLVNQIYNHDVSINFTGAASPKWEMLKLEAAAINSKYKNFLALPGYEVSTSFLNHINILNTAELCGKMKSINKFQKWLNQQKNAILTINHPYRINNDIKYIAELAQYIKLFEVGHGAPPKQYVRCLKKYFDTLDYG